MCCHYIHATAFRNPLESLRSQQTDKARVLDSRICPSSHLLRFSKVRRIILSMDPVVEERVARPEQNQAQALRPTQTDTALK